MFLLVDWDGQSLSGYAQSSQAPCRLVLRVAGSSLAYRQTEHAPWHHLTLELHPGRLATTLPSMWHWTAALRAQSRPVARSSHTHSSINSPSFQLRNCELIRASVTTASPCWGHYLDQTLGSEQGFVLRWMAWVIVWATDEQNRREKLKTSGDYDGRKWDKLCLYNKSHRDNMATCKLSSISSLRSLYSETLNLIEHFKGRTSCWIWFLA